MGEPNKVAGIDSIESSQSQDRKILIKSPEIHIIDAGCWLRNRNYFAAISGRSIAIGRVLTKVHQIIDSITMIQSELTSLFSAVNRAELFKGKISDLNPTLKNLFDSQDVLTLYRNANDPIFQKAEVWIELVASVKSEPLTLLEIAKGDDLLCGTNELFVFIPDMHICLGDKDPCDFFRYGLDNTVTLNWFTRRVKQLSGTIIQTGDMFDFWMAEVDSRIYYSKEDSLEQGDLVPRNATARMMEAAKQLDRSLGTDRMVEILFNIDKYVLGNHDWEMSFPGASIQLAGKVKDSKIHSETHPLRINGTAISVTHGHFFESYNDTSLVTVIEADSYMKVYGKTITMDYARGLRGTAYLLPREEGDQDSWSSWADFSKFWASKSGRVLANYGGFLDAATNVTQFNEMRHGALSFLVKTLTEKNPRYIFQLDNPSVISFFDPNRTIYWYGQNGADNPPAIMTKVLVHSHSHMPFITKVKLVYDKDLPAKQRSVSDILKAMGDPDPNNNPLMPPQIFSK